MGRHCCGVCELLAAPPLRRHACSKPAGVTGVNDLSRLVLPTLLGVFAYLAQFAVPLLCLVAAAISAWKARARSTLVTTVASSAASRPQRHDVGAVRTPRRRGFRLQGYTVTETGGVGVGDGGVDLVLKRGPRPSSSSASSGAPSRLESTSCASSSASWQPRAPPAALW